MMVLLFGSRGYLGRKFLSMYPDAACPEADIADPQAVARALDEARPDVVINTAGKTGVPNVDWCEDHKRETLRSNVTGPLVLLEECAKRGIYWVHLGSGCIYEGEKGTKGKKGEKGEMEESGWTEDDEPNFTGSFYSRTKAMADRALRECCAPIDGKGDVLILRLRMPFDGTDHPRNLITKLRKFSRVLDVPNSITAIPDFLAAARTLIERRRTGIYHVVNDGAISLYRIMELYREIVDPAHTFERLLLGSLPQVVRAGRSNCILSTQKLKEEGIAVRPVEKAVREALLEMKHLAPLSHEAKTLSTSCVQVKN